jgi:AbrB family looped-hinge helix DNA binding protein
MTNATATAKGQIVIPAELRKKLAIEPGTRLVVYEENGRIVLQPARDYVRSVKGILAGSDDLLDALTAERAKEREKEDRG